MDASDFVQEQLMADALEENHYCAVCGSDVTDIFAVPIEGAYYCSDCLPDEL